MQREPASGDAWYSFIVTSDRLVYSGCCIRQAQCRGGPRYTVLPDGRTAIVGQNGPDILVSGITPPEEK